MRIVIDTNILVSAAIKDKIPEKVILWVVSNPEVLWIVSDDIINEYLNVISRPKFKLHPEVIQQWIELIYESVNIENPDLKIDFVTDKFDAKFIECAVFSKADFIITGDGHFENVENQFKTKVISVQEFYRQFISK